MLELTREEEAAVQAALARGQLTPQDEALRARAAAARREADAAVRERQALADAARESTRARTAELAQTRLPATDTADRDAALAARTSRALRAYVAAQRWHGLAPEERREGGVAVRRVRGW